jgi:hypothetical protein
VRGLSPRQVIAAADRLTDTEVYEICGPGGLSGATEEQHQRLVALARHRAEHERWLRLVAARRASRERDR